MKLLVANRGEIAIRLMRAAAELDIPTVAIAPADDASALHTVKANESVTLPGSGPAAYLDIAEVVATAKETGCDAVHPGYGFLAENGDFARACNDAGITYVGPSAEMLDLFGDKARARAAAIDAGVPIIRGIDHAVTLEEANAFFAELGASRSMMIKAIAGGGGRGSRMVDNAEDVATTFERCASEAAAAFGNSDLYVEEFIREARHIEVQILGDSAGNIAHLGERECSVQRHFQKVVEIAPAPALDGSLRDEIIAAAVRLASHVGYFNAGTFEFLVDTSGSGQPFAFIEANARLQVEHTVTEEVTGVDIVQSQLRIAQGATIADLGLDDPAIAEARGYAIQARVCMESMGEDGSVRPEAGTLTAYEAPSGPGVRTDGFGYAGYATSLLYDSLLAKVIGHSPSRNFADAVTRTARALAEFRIEGITTNIGFIQNILSHPGFVDYSAIHTRFIDEEIASLARNTDAHTQFVAEGSDDSDGAVDGPAEAVGPEGAIGLRAPMQGTIVEIGVAVGDEVLIGQPVAVVEAMQLQHDVKADQAGIVAAVSMSVGDVVREGYPIVFIHESDEDLGAVESDTSAALDSIRDDMAEVNEWTARTLDAAHPEAVAALHALGRRTPRENLDDLIDAGSFREFGPPASGSVEGGTVMGMGTVNAMPTGTTGRSRYMNSCVTGGGH